MSIGTERKSLIVFMIVAVALVAGAFWLIRWLSTGGPTRAVAEPGQIVFISDRMGEPDLWIMEEDGSNAKRLVVHPGQERETLFAPDGEWIYYTSEFGGNVYQIGRARPTGRGAGKLLAGTDAEGSISITTTGPRLGYIRNSQMFSSELDGKNPRRELPSAGDESLGADVAQVAEGDAPALRRYSYTHYSPTKGWIAAISQAYDNQRAFLSLGRDWPTGALLGPDGKQSLGEEVFFDWSPDGDKLVLSCYGPPGITFLAVYAPSADMEAPQAIPAFEPSVVLLEDRTNGIGIRRPVWSANGKIYFERVINIKDGAREEDGIWEISPEGGKPKRIIEGRALFPKPSPDGRFLLYIKGPDIYRYEFETGQSKNLTNEQGINRFPSWSPILNNSN